MVRAIVDEVIFLMDSVVVVEWSMSEMVVVWMKKGKRRMWEGELFVRCGGLASDCASGTGLSDACRNQRRKNVKIKVISRPIRTRAEVDIRAEPCHVLPQRAQEHQKKSGLGHSGCANT